MVSEKPLNVQSNAPSEDMNLRTKEHALHSRHKCTKGKHTNDRIMQIPEAQPPLNGQVTTHVFFTPLADDADSPKNACKPRSVGWPAPGQIS